MPQRNTHPTSINRVDSLRHTEETGVTPRGQEETDLVHQKDTTWKRDLVNWNEFIRWFLSEYQKLPRTTVILKSFSVQSGQDGHGGGDMKREIRNAIYDEIKKTGKHKFLIPFQAQTYVRLALHSHVFQQTLEWNFMLGEHHFEIWIDFSIERDSTSWLTVEVAEPIFPVVEESSTDSDDTLKIIDSLRELTIVRPSQWVTYEKGWEHIHTAEKNASTLMENVYHPHKELLINLYSLTGVQWPLHSIPAAEYLKAKLEQIFRLVGFLHTTSDDMENLHLSECIHMLTARLDQLELSRR